ncbi:Uncharacterised protein [Mycobacteroides abscessus subsp. abscessus]|nr:Uncharacterised protein [Mycobacteroides abscessus subsp. abscessus]
MEPLAAPPLLAGMNAAGRVLAELCSASTLAEALRRSFDEARSASSSDFSACRIASVNRRASACSSLLPSGAVTVPSSATCSPLEVASSTSNITLSRAAVSAECPPRTASATLLIANESRLVEDCSFDAWS